MTFVAFVFACAGCHIVSPRFPPQQAQRSLGTPSAPASEALAGEPLEKIALPTDVRPRSPDSLSFGMIGKTFHRKDAKGAKNRVIEIADRPH